MNSLDLPRRSRHIEIRLLWLRAKIEAGEIQIRHKSGKANVADLFTKCLPTADFKRHRTTLGFEVIERPFEDLNELFFMGSGTTENPEYCVVEVCCSSNSNVKRACIRSGIKYIGVTSNMERRSVQERVQELVGVQAKLGKWIHVHVSTPCRTGRTSLSMSVE
ncbi:unnamed protein product [Durusdinium trenchii]|uniref:Uncharacterized protein n=1 Tax=Durusdinium trenchii TaxID=1381693 RepID=A0ABP0RGT0_9DINO